MYHFTFRKTVALHWRKLIGNECIPAAAESIKVLPLAVSSAVVKSDDVRSHNIYNPIG